MRTCRCGFGSRVHFIGRLSQFSSVQAGRNKLSVLSCSACDPGCRLRVGDWVQISAFNASTLEEGIDAGFQGDALETRSCSHRAPVYIMRQTEANRGFPRLFLQLLDISRKRRSNWLEEEEEEEEKDLLQMTAQQEAARRRCVAEWPSKRQKHHLRNEDSKGIAEKCRGGGGGGWSQQLKHPWANSNCRLRLTGISDEHRSTRNGIGHFMCNPLAPAVSAPSTG